MIDTHSHIYDEAYALDFEAVVARAKEAGVEKIIMPGIDSSCHSAMMATESKLHGFAYPAIGLHPTSINENWHKELDFVFEHYEKESFCAIGEIGIDEYWSKDFLTEQMEAFEAQLSFSYENDLPVIIHNRDGLEDIVKSIKRVAKPVRGVFHAFNGSVETYERICRLGDFFIGIGGVVTFKNAHIATSLEKIPISSILLETDAPWLTPAPHRGERNESSYLKFTAEKISAITGLSFEEIDTKTTMNAKNLFNL